MDGRKVFSVKRKGSYMRVGYWEFRIMDILSSHKNAMKNGELWLATKEEGIRRYYSLTIVRMERKGLIKRGKDLVTITDFGLELLKDLREFYSHDRYGEDVSCQSI